MNGAEFDSSLVLRRFADTLIRMLRLLVLLLFATFSFSASGQQTTPYAPPSQDLLHAVHDALFSSFLPVEELKQDPQLFPLFVGVRDRIWAAANQSTGFRQLLAPFADLRSFGMTCGIASYLQGTPPEPFNSLTPVQREHVLSLLETCDRNEPRRLVMTVRNFYIVRTYDPIQEQLSGVHLNVSESHDWIEQHRPNLPHTRLRFDQEKHEIFSTDGPIDYLIVGSGPAGSVLAHELRRGGKHVLLIERGSFIVPGSMQTRLIGDLIDARTSADGGIIIHNGMAVGGGSQVNVDLCFAPTLPSVQAKINGWRREGRIGPNDFTKDKLASAYDWVKSAIGTRTLPESEINANNHVLWDGALREGLHPKLYDLNTYPPGQSPYTVTDKRSSETQLLMEALQDTNNPLSMVPDADVRRVLFEDQHGERKAVGVEIRARLPISEDGAITDPNGFGLSAGETVVVHSRNVILAAGALGSPAILLRSGVKNDQIGRGIILHPSMPILGKFDRTIDVLNGTEASVYVDDHLVDRGYALESMSAPPVYAAIMSPGSAMHTFQMIRSFHNMAGFGVMLVDTPSSTNRLVLDENGEPVIEYQLSEGDKQRFRQGIRQAVRVMFRAGAKEVYLPSTEGILGGSRSSQSKPVVLTNIHQADKVERNLHLIPNRSIVTSAHMQAADKMGAAQSDSVVAHDFHVWGTTSLYVVDGSIFPTSIGANPMQSIYTFAKVFSDRMIK